MGRRQAREGGVGENCGAVRIDRGVANKKAKKDRTEENVYSRTRIDVRVYLTSGECPLPDDAGLGETVAKEVIP